VREINLDNIQPWLDATECHFLYTPQLIAEVGRLPKSATQADGLDGVRLLAMATVLKLWTPRPLRSWAHFRKILTKFRKSAGRTNAPFGPAPTAGTLGEIELLRDAEEMCAEGRALHHCLGLGEHVLRVLAADSFYYRVLQPQRGTVEITREFGGPWQMGQFRWVENEFPDSDSIAALDLRLKDLVGADYRLGAEGRAAAEWAVRAREAPTPPVGKGAAAAA
jgi:hypothetical protein